MYENQSFWNEHDITLGEICNTLRGVWGEYVAKGFKKRLFRSANLFHCCRVSYLVSKKK